MGFALLFSGQGAQHAQMLPWLAEQPEAAATLERLAASIGPNWSARLDDPAWMTSNRIAQPLLTGIGIAAWQCLAARLPPPTVVAGYSVGELAAFAAAGVFEPDVALALAVDRAGAMSDSVAGLEDTGLLSVHGPGARALAERREGLATAIRIDDDRIVVGGPARALDAACADWAAAGMRCIRLAVSLASHTPWMAAAAASFARRLDTVPFRAPGCAVVCDVSGAATRDPHALAHALAAQIERPVRWGDCMDTIAERRVGCVLEVGPGSTLASMWRERHPGIAARSIDEFRSPEGAAAWVTRHLASAD
jgi:[acyl-carrier-protein] S-malonyltransferase